MHSCNWTYIRTTAHWLPLVIHLSLQSQSCPKLCPRLDLDGHSLDHRPTHYLLQKSIHITKKVRRRNPFVGRVILRKFFNTKFFITKVQLHKNFRIYGINSTIATTHMMLHWMIEHNKLIFTVYPPWALIDKISVLQWDRTFHYSS